MRADIVLCADSRFALGAWMGLWSAAQRWEGDGKPQFHLLTSESEGRAISKIRTLAEKWRISLNIMSVGSEALALLPPFRQSAHTYFRVLAPELLSDIPRFLYLDSDVLVRTSVHPILEELPAEAVLSAVQDFVLPTMAQGLHYFPVDDPGAPYFNTGVMGVNTGEWKKARITTRVLDFLQRYAPALAYADQDGLNGVLQGRIHFLDPAWNVQLGAIEFCNSHPGELLSRAKIVHFTGASKPWIDGFRMACAGEYREAIFESGWIDRKWEACWRLRWLAGAILRAAKRRRNTLRERTLSSKATP